MQWNQIKTLFILSFLILDIYLLGQFLERENQADIGILEQESSSVEQLFEEEDIKIPDLPEEIESEPFISVSQKVFTEEEEKTIHDKKGQEIFSFDNHIISKLKKPIKISEDEAIDNIEATVQSLISFSDEYTFWDWNKEMNIIIFFQEKMKRPIYFNQNGVVFVFLDDENQITSYTQTVLGDADAREDEKDLITPLKAIETLYQANELRTGDEITKVDMGFHTRIPLANGVQVFVPAWKVTINQDVNHFVNAIEGWNFSSNEMNFIKDSITYDLEKIQWALDDGEIEEKKTAKEMIEFLERKLDL